MFVSLNSSIAQKSALFFSIYQQTLLKEIKEHSMFPIIWLYSDLMGVVRIMKIHYDYVMFLKLVQNYRVEICEILHSYPQFLI